ncbi:MAG TPA: BON domain-containing protein, partial [Ktedonobacterales bacterium]|nr:BON domain-containing protein [Ktedonobacterales bacterium]
TRYRGDPERPMGRLLGARVRPASSELWLRLRPDESLRPWGRTVRTIPLNSTQSPTPTPDTIDLRGGMRVRCHEGYIGRLEGLALDLSAGLALDLLVRIRSDPLAEVSMPSDPFFKLVDVQGQRVLLSPSWAVSTTPTGGVHLRGGGLTLLLNASIEQVASGTLVRRDDDLTGAIWQILDANPALAPYIAQLRVVVHDGDVTLLGTLPSPRHRASAEQEAWHIPGVFTLHNEITIG